MSELNEFGWEGNNKWGWTFDTASKYLGLTKEETQKLPRTADYANGVVDICMITRLAESADLATLLQSTPSTNGGVLRDDVTSGDLLRLKYAHVGLLYATGIIDALPSRGGPAGTDSDSKAALVPK